MTSCDLWGHKRAGIVHLEREHYHLGAADRRVGIDNRAGEFGVDPVSAGKPFRFPQLATISVEFSSATRRNWKGISLPTFPNSQESSGMNCSA